MLSTIEYSNVNNFLEYPYLSNVKKLQTNEDKLTLECKLNKGKIVSEIDNPNNRERITLLIRNKNKSNFTLFKITWCIK